MTPKLKACSAIGKARGTDVTGCGKEVYKRTYGLCDSCLKEWKFETPEGRESQLPRCKECNDRFKPLNNNPNQKHCLEKDKCITAHAKLSKKVEFDNNMKIVEKQKRERSPIVYPTKYKKYMNDECQKLARMIDAKFGYVTCIDCDKHFGNQVDGGHFNSKGKNPTLAWNLHNIHSQKSDCNQNGIGGGRERQYYDGLINRYGAEYAEMVDIGLQKEYQYIGLTRIEVAEKLAIVRKLIRNFDTFVFKDAIQARTMFNNLIGIYT
jgi:hypothetical protein